MKSTALKVETKALKVKAKSSKPPAIHFIHRQAARILKVVLKGNAERRAQESLKSLVFKPSVIAKKATFALICQTLKYLPVIKEVLEAVKLPDEKHKKQAELFYVLTNDLLTEKEVVPSGDAEAAVLSRKAAIHAAFVRMLVKKNVTDIDGLLPPDRPTQGNEFPRYVRVNTIKVSVEGALEKLEQYGAERDDLLPDLLVLPAGTDLHDHYLVVQGYVFLQGKASCLPAHALRPEENWVVLDACAAPGNKTVHLAALMNNKGRVIACEMNKARWKVLQATIKRANATCAETLLQDFLTVDPSSPNFSRVKAILLDPSCSGSGTTAQRLDYLLPATVDNKEAEAQRLQKLASFQKSALQHALSFPSVDKVVYSTCSLNQAENEDVVQSVLDFARSRNFQLAKPFPEWPHRGLPVFDGAENLVRTDPARDKMDGFFVALFQRKGTATRGKKRKKLRKKGHSKSLGGEGASLKEKSSAEPGDRKKRSLKEKSCAEPGDKKRKPLKEKSSAEPGDKKRKSLKEKSSAEPGDKKRMSLKEKSSGPGEKKRKKKKQRVENASA